MRTTKYIRSALAIAGTSAIVWGAVFGLSPAKAEDGQPQAADTTTTLDPSSTTSSTTSTTVAPTTTTSAPSGSTTTTVVTSGDPDGDGVSNEPAVDLFDDGVTADQDPTVAVIPTGANEGVIVALDTDGNEELRNVAWSNPGKIGTIALPSGVVSFNIVNANGPVDVVVDFPDKNTAAHTLYKGTSSTMTAFTTTDHDFSDGEATFMYTVTDGGNGDADHAANGTIVDPVGPGFVQAASTTPTTARTSTIVRTGTDVGKPTVAGIAALVIGALMLAVAWKPRGAHFRFNR